MPSTNPLFPTSDNDAPASDGYVLPKQDNTVQPPSSTTNNGAEAAISLIRDKLARIYAEEPNAQTEEQQATITAIRSKHQQFMYDLNTSGKSLAEIQKAWHDYYAALPDAEKHRVWQEFYEASARAHEQHAQGATKQQGFEPYKPLPPQPAVLSQAFAQAKQQPELAAKTTAPAALADTRTPADLMHIIRNTITANGRLGLKHHLQSLSFGLAIGVLTIIITLFGLFNEVVIAPFIQPSRSVSATPIIIDPSAVTTSSTPEIIIPKINLEIPVDYSAASDDENVIQNALLNGIVHYPSTVLPGQTGNAAFFGHSSNNIFNPGKYKFAFVLLHELVPGDTFYITYNGKAYIYKVFSRTVVEPDDIGVLNNIPGHPATATLITCDPPGTALHRLVVVGDQISPDPSTNGAGDNAGVSAAANTRLPDNGPSLLQRIWNSIF